MKKQQTDSLAIIGVLFLISAICVFSYYSYELIGGVGEGDYNNGQDAWTTEDIQGAPSWDQ